MPWLILTHEEAEHIALSFNLRDIGDVPLPASTPRFGGPVLRLTFTKAALTATDPMMFELDVASLWALDTLLTDGDTRGEKLPSGEPVLGLVKKVWRAIIEAEEGGDAYHDQDYDADANDGTPALGSRDGEGAGEMVSAADP